MQTIGMMNDGRRLAILTTLEYDILELIDQRTEVRQLSQAPIPATEPVALQKNARGGRAATTAAIPDKAKRQKTTHPWRAAMAAEVAIAAAKRAKPDREKICVICGDNFHDASNTNSRKVCKKISCKITLKKRYMKNFRLTHGKTTARSAAATTMPPNPSDPFLTDEQRKEMMARREKLIAASAQKHAED